MFATFDDHDDRIERCSMLQHMELVALQSWRESYGRGSVAQMWVVGRELFRRPLARTYSVVDEHVPLHQAWSRDCGFLRCLGATGVRVHVCDLQHLLA